MDPNLASTMTFLQSLCTTEQQKQMLAWMQTQPKGQLESFLKNAVATLPRDDLAPLIDAHLSTHPPETREQILSQVTQAYDFLKTT